MKIKLYPEGYSPRIAAALPSVDLKRMGIDWNKIQHLEMKKLESEAQIVEVSVVPTGRWYEKV